MELIDRYLQAVGFWLPRKQRQDILAELAEDLQSQIEEKEAGLNRKLSEAELESLLKEPGCANCPVIAVAVFLLGLWARGAGENSGVCGKHCSSFLDASPGEPSSGNQCSRFRAVLLVVQGSHLGRDYSGQGPSRAHPENHQRDQLLGGKDLPSSGDSGRGRFHQRRVSDCAGEAIAATASFGPASPLANKLNYD